MRIGKSSGFTLIEVLVAFAILAISAGALLSAFSTGTRHSALSRDYSQAVVLAEGKLAEIGVVDAIAPGEQAGRFDDRFSWRLNVSEYVPDQENSKAYRSFTPYHVEIEVNWVSSNTQRRLTLDTLRLVTQLEP